MLKISFTGHRPNKLGGYQWGNKIQKEVSKEIEKNILEIIERTEEKEIVFYSGGAIGVDQIAFEVVDGLKEVIWFINEDITIKNNIAIPFKDQDRLWKINDKERYKSQKERADNVIYVDTEKGYEVSGTEKGKYDIRKMQKRNEYMVDNSDILIAVFDGSKSGTKNCIDYAKKHNKEIIIIDLNKIKNKLLIANQ